MPLIVEAYRLRSLMFEWRKSAGDACKEFQDYKGGLWCARCEQTADAHALKQCADQLKALMDEVQQPSCA